MIIIEINLGLQFLWFPYNNFFKNAVSRAMVFRLWLQIAILLFRNAVFYKGSLTGAFFKMWPWIMRLSSFSEPSSWENFTPCPSFLLCNCFPKLPSLLLSEKWQWRTNLALNALLLTAPYVTHLGRGSLGFCLCVFREGTDNQPTEWCWKPNALCLQLHTPSQKAMRKCTEGYWVQRPTKD